MDSQLRLIRARQQSLPYKKQSTSVRVKALAPDNIQHCTLLNYPIARYVVFLPLLVFVPN